MEWIAANWELLAAIAGLAVAILKALGQARYARVIEALVVSIETADAKDVKALAQSASFKNGTDKVLAALVKKLTEGESK